MPLMLMDGIENAKADILERVGDLSEFNVFHNYVVVALYVRPEKTASGIILTDKTRDEDRFQGKAGMIVKLGPSAFDDQSGRWEWATAPKLHDWVWFRASDGLSMSINDDKGLCRVLMDTSVMGTLPRPDMIW